MSMSVNAGPDASVPVIEAQDVAKQFGEGETLVRALRGVNLRAERGEMLAIMGPSGSGKSTLLGIISGLDTATGGRVFINGREITHLSEGRLAAVRNKEIGFIFQTFNLVSTLSALENVELPIQLDPHSRFNPARRARDVLESVGLGDRIHHRPAQMSGGEQQRVAIARALVNDPLVLFGDEPTGNLDSANGEAVMALLKELNRTTGKTVIIVTHDPNVGAQCHRTLFMKDGQIVTERKAVPVTPALEESVP
ncbi:MAG TPA: ABC transporter ATP-binding protein [Chloroflexota bacterium]|nr:ABC transporter ATP-binding protein [Chloroflexota bacterium]